MPLAEQELPTLQEHLSLPPIFSGVRVPRSLVLCVMFCISLFVLLSFFWPLHCLSFNLRILITFLVSPISFCINFSDIESKMKTKTILIFLQYLLRTYCGRTKYCYNKMILILTYFSNLICLLLLNNFFHN